MRKPITAPAVRAFMTAREDLDVLRIHYCYQIGSTFVSLALMEDAIFSAMSICDRIKVAKLLGPDVSSWNLMIDKTNKLQSSTLGNLISILSKHGVAPGDIDYLKWIKAKRDFFVHRLFRQGDWPGELGEEQINALCRKLLYLETIFVRASHRVWRIFGRANLMVCEDLGEDGVLIMNLGLLDDEDDR